MQLYCNLISDFKILILFQEGQARVRDFLQTRKDTERKRGYFD